MKRSAERFAMEYLDHKLADMIRRIEIEKIHYARAHDALEKISDLEQSTSINTEQLNEVDDMLKKLDRRNR